MEKFFDIAGFRVSLRLTDSMLWSGLSNYAPFEVESAGEPVLELKQIEAVLEEEPLPLLVSEEEQFPRITIGKINGGRWFFTLAPLHNLPVTCRCVASEDFSKAEFEILDGKYAVFSVNNAIMLLYALRTATLGCLEIHASVVVKDGKGVVFLGKSGTGKSTHSRLWLENITGAELLNDDNPIIRCHEDGRILVYGSPWSGKTPCYKNVNVPLAAVVRLSQAPENKMCRLSLVEAYASIYPSVSAFRPHRTLADGLHDTIAKICMSVPCFSLDCLPDRDAALLSYKNVYGQDKHT